jgi:GT2 family glycosyltransferase
VAVPAVMAVVVNWNGASVIEACLRTLAASRYENLGVILVDNASTDDSVRMVRDAFPSVDIRETGRNLGYAAGANHGLRAARETGADFILLLNNDVEIAPDAVSELVRAAEERPRALLLGPKIYYHSEPDVIWSAGGEISFWSGHIRHLGIRERDTGQYDVERAVDYLTGCALLLPVRTLEVIGCLDETYYMYNEDTDWSTRAVRSGGEVLYVPTARLWHKVSTSSGGGLTAYKIYHRIRSTLTYFRRYARWYQWFSILPATALRAAGFAIGQMLSGERGRVKALIRGILDGVTGKRRAYTND